MPLEIFTMKFYMLFPLWPIWYNQVLWHWKLNVKDGKITKKKKPGPSNHPLEEHCTHIMTAVWTWPEQVYWLLVEYLSPLNSHIYYSMKMDLGALSIFPLLSTIKALQADDGDTEWGKGCVFRFQCVLTQQSSVHLQLPTDAQWSAAPVTASSVPLWF